jgi:uncharacterized protein (TIGR03435 family)
VWIRTELSGPFDVDLYWSPSGPRCQDRFPPEVDGPSLFTAVPGAAWLKLQARTEQQDVYVVDSIERPRPIRVDSW